MVDSNSIMRDPPYKAFLTNNGKAIAIMLYENALKVIPVNRKPVQLGNAFNIRLMQPEIMQVYPTSEGIGFLYC